MGVFSTAAQLAALLSTVASPGSGEDVASDPGAVESPAVPIQPPTLVRGPAATRPPGSDPSEAAEVLLSIVIDTNGRVIESRVVRSGGAAFDAAATRAVRRFVFRPALEGDTPIEVEINYRYVFPAEPPPQPEVPLDVDAEVEVVWTERTAPEAAEVALVAEEAERVPGSQGDAVKAAQSVAGVGRPALGTGELVLWGASPDETRREVDWILVPRLFHLGGGRSIVPGPRVDQVHVVPGGFGPATGRATGGLVRVDTRTQPQDVSRAAGGFVRVDPVDVGGGVHARLGDRGWISTSARRGLLPQTYGRIAPPDARAVVPLPQSWDHHSQATIRLEEGRELRVLALGAEDVLRRGIPSRTADVAFEEQAFSAFHRLGAQLQQTRSDGSSATVSGWFGRDRDRLLQDFASVQVRDARDTWRAGLRVAGRRRLARFAVLQWGVDAEMAHANLQREGALTLPARDGDVVVFGQAPGDRVAEDSWRSTQASVAGYVSVPFEFAQGRWLLEPGIRVEPTVQSGDRILPVRPIEPEIGYANLETPVLPRGRVRWRPLSTLEVFAAGGLYAQAPAQGDVSAVFGQPELRLSRATHALAGLSGTPHPRVRLSGTGFWNRSRRRVGRSADPTPPVAQLLVADGEGRSYGGQAIVRGDPTDNVLAQLTYSWTRSERRDPGADAFRRSDFDQTHVFGALSSWQHRSGLELGGRAVLTSGFPRTDVVDAVPNVRTGDWDPVFGEQAATRLPLFFELSARIAWHHKADWGSVRTWLDVQNVTNRANASEVFYSVDYSQRGFLRGMPILPLVGLEVML